METLFSGVDDMLLALMMIVLSAVFGLAVRGVAVVLILDGDDVEEFIFGVGGAS